MGEETSLRKRGEGKLVEKEGRNPFLPVNLASSSQLDFYPLFILEKHGMFSRASNIFLDVK